MNDNEFAAIKNAFSEHGLVFFRDQNISEETHINFASRIGTINVNRFFAAHPAFPKIALVTKEPEQESNIGGDWHTDHSYDQIPATGSILVARELPESGGDTCFVSMHDAFEGLSDGLKEMLKNLKAVHSAKHVFGEDSGYHDSESEALGGRIGNSEATNKMTDAIHPVVISHPLSGKPVLYINPGFTIGFDGWTIDESKPLLDYLYKQAVREENVCHFKWKPGSIAFWDNRLTWHNAKNDYAGQRREMHRITLDGCSLTAA